MAYKSDAQVDAEIKRGLFNVLAIAGLTYVMTKLSARNKYRKMCVEKGGTPEECAEEAKKF